MLEAKYYRDYGHNYMILQCEKQEKIRSYQYNILTSGKISDILSCSVRHINGMTYYYYDISSRTTLESLYRNKKISYETVKDVLYQIHGICEKLAGYFMEEMGLVLLPEHIYYDLTDQKYIGLYYPDYKADGPNAYKPLMDFLLENIDTEDRKLTESMYQICEMAEENNFFIEDALRILEDGEDSARRTDEEPLHNKYEEPVMVNIDYYDTAEDPPEREQADKISRGKSLFYPILAVLSALGTAGAVAVHTIYDLTLQEEIVLYGLMAVMGVCLLFCLIGIMKGSRGRTAAGKVTDEKSGREYQPDFNEDAYIDFKRKTDADYPTDRTLPPLSQVISRNTDINVAENRSVEETGNTVFFDERAVREYKLYALDHKNKKHIDLKRFPCTVGKMAGFVDYVLADDSISRIHARFDRQGEKVLLTDMNSTNGTYKNGLRMQPQETVEIEPGDEVRFGNLNYCYR